MKAHILCALTPLLAVMACANHPPLETVPEVDLDRYLGLWYEIARLPNSFQEDCYCATAQYALLEEDSIEVVNTCREDSPTGEEDSADGEAWPVEGGRGAKLEVQFFWPFSGDYWIIGLDEVDYQVAMVGTPSREYLWILARDPVIPEQTYEEYVSRASQLGFDTSQLIRRDSGCAVPEERTDEGGHENDS